MALNQPNLNNQASPNRINSLSDLDRWYQNNLAASKGTANNYRYWLLRYCKDRCVTHQQLIEEAQDIKTCEDRLHDWIIGLQNRGLAGKTINLALYAVKSWFEFNRIDIQRKIKIKGAASTPTVENEKIPTKEELQRILKCAALKTKAVASLMAYSGLRPEIIANLKLGDLQLNERPIRITVLPDVPGNKAKIRFFTFNNGGYLLEYLRDRAKKERLTAATKLFDAQSHTLAALIRRAFKNASFKGRPYVLRSYFANACDSARIKHSAQQFFMGHKGDIEMVYTLRKHLSPEKIEELRNEYRMVEKFL